MIVLDAEQKVRELINSNLYDVVNLDDIKRSFNVQIDKNTKGYIEETLDLYKKYLYVIENLPSKIQDGFLETLKRNEIKHTQKAEDQDMFMLELYRTLDQTNSIDMGIDIINKNKKLTSDDLLKLHDKIMEGTNCNKCKGYRLKDDKVVAGIEYGKSDIHFIPIRKEEIPEAMNLITEFLNTECLEEELFTKPFVAHALIGIVQAFPDGNTRLARLVNQLKIWELTKKFNISYINMPALYMSKSFYMMRSSYRENLRRIVVDKTDEAWNRWIRFNLNAVNEQLYFGMEKSEKIKRGL